MSKCTIDSGMRENFILIYLFFLLDCLLDDVLCNIAIWDEDTAFKASCGKLYALSQQVEKGYEFNLILKIQICWKIFLFFISYFLILKRQDLVLKVIYSSSNIKSCYSELV